LSQTEIFEVGIAEDLKEYILFIHFGFHFFGHGAEMMFLAIMMEAKVCPIGSGAQQASTETGLFEGVHIHVCVQL